MSDNFRRWIEKLIRQKDATRAIAKQGEWRIAPEERETTPEAKIAVASLIGELRLEWRRGWRAR